MPSSRTRGRGSLNDRLEAAVPTMTTGSRRRYQDLLDHHLFAFVLWRLSPAIWGLPLLLDEMRGHPRLLLYGLLYAAWVGVGGLVLVTQPYSWPVRTARLLVSFFWFYLVFVSIQ